LIFVSLPFPEGLTLGNLNVNDVSLFLRMIVPTLSKKHGTILRNRLAIVEDPLSSPKRTPLTPGSSDQVGTQGTQGTPRHSNSSPGLYFSFNVTCVKSIKLYDLETEGRPAIKYDTIVITDLSEEEVAGEVSSSANEEDFPDEEIETYANYLEQAHGNNTSLVPKSHWQCMRPSSLETPNVNQKITDALEILHVRHTLQCSPEAKFRAMQYRKAITALRRLPFKINTLEDLRKANLSCIGHKIAVRNLCG
jgi:hypothetical protein